MAMYHYKEQFFTNNKGTSKWSKIAYFSGSKFKDEKENHTYNYENKTEVVYFRIYLCQNAPKEYEDRKTLWQSVEKVENRKNSQYAKYMELSLSNELTLEQAKLCMDRYGEYLASQGMCADLSLHWQEGNHHIQGMRPLRQIDEDGQWMKKTTKIGNKCVALQDWEEREKLMERRKLWADLQNEFLSPELQVSEKSYKAQGIEKTPRRFLSRGDYEEYKKIQNGLDYDVEKIDHVESITTILTEEKNRLEEECLALVLKAQKEEKESIKETSVIEKEEPEELEDDFLEVEDFEDSEVLAVQEALEKRQKFAEIPTYVYVYGYDLADLQTMVKKQDFKLPNALWERAVQAQYDIYLARDYDKNLTFSEFTESRYGVAWEPGLDSRKLVKAMKKYYKENNLSFPEIRLGKKKIMEMDTSQQENQAKFESQFKLSKGGEEKIQEFLNGLSGAMTAEPSGTPSRDLGDQLVAENEKMFWEIVQKLWEVLEQQLKILSQSLKKEIKHSFHL